MRTNRTNLDPARERTNHDLVEERARTDLAIHQAEAGEAEPGRADKGSDARRAADGATSPARRTESAAFLRRVEDELALEREHTDTGLRRERAQTDQVVDDANTDVVRRDELLAVVSHELRSPLTVITLNTQTLLSEPPGLTKVETKAILRDIQASSAQMNSLIADLLDVAGMEMGHLKLTLTHGDALSVLHAAMAASAPMLEERKLSLTVDAPPGPLFARIDPSRLLQVFANLFANAVKFTEPGGAIFLSVARVGTTLQFCVADTGCGVTPSAVPHVFERFWQLGKTDRRGLGLGLYLCKAIVEAHSGRIWVVTTEGVGSSFYFTVPEAGQDLAAGGSVVAR